MASTPLSAEHVLKCAFCDDTNTNKKCIKCQRNYCILHTSKISPNLCQECFKGVQVLIEEHFTKETEVYHEASDSVRTVKQECKQVRMDGPDYVWYSVMIQQLTDQELAEILEFHRFMVSQIEVQKAVNLVKKLQKLREDDATPRLTLSTETRKVQKKSIKQTKSLKDILIAQGITGDLLTKMLEAAGQKEPQH